MTPHQGEDDVDQWSSPEDENQRKDGAGRRSPNEEEKQGEDEASKISPPEKKQVDTISSGEDCVVVDLTNPESNTDVPPPDEEEFACVSNYSSK